MNDINIVGGTLCDKNGEFKADLGISGGRISQICRAGDKLENACETVNAAGKVIIPAMIDTHTHIRGAEFSYREDFCSGTRAAASGGVSTIFEMPGGSVPCVTPNAFKQRRREMERDCITQFEMYAGAGYDNCGEIEPLAACKAVGFKTFMNPPLAGREKEFYGLCSPDMDSLEKVMKAVKKTGLTLTVHCEDYGIITSETQRLKSTGADGAEAYFASHPDISEIKAVKNAIACAEKTGCPLNIAHVSTAWAAELIADARKRGTDISAETTMHYLFYHSGQMKKYGSFARMKPPFRSAGNRDRLLEIVRDSDFFYLGSDHAPFTLDEKKPEGSIWDAADGLAGIEMSLRLLLELVYEKKLTLQKAAEISSFNAAGRFGIGDKGLIKEGYQADIALLELNVSPYKLKKEEMLTKAYHNGAIYEETVLHSRIKAVYSAGKKIFDDGEIRA